MSSYLIRMKKPKGKWSTEAQCGSDEEYARDLLEKFKRNNPGCSFELVEQKSLFDTEVVA